MPDHLIKEDLVAIIPENKLIFRYLPAYAKFIRENHLLSYVKETLRLSREMDLPLLKYLRDMSEDELIGMSLKSSDEILMLTEENRLSEHLEKSLKLWVEDKLGVMKRDAVTADDINLAGHIRKRAFLKFLPLYTSDVEESVEIMKEIDTYSTESDKVFTNVYITLLKDRLSKTEYWHKQAQELSNVGNWTWDLKTNKIEWTDSLYNIYGITHGTELTFEEIAAFSSEEDRVKIKQKMRQVLNTYCSHETFFNIILKDGTKKILHAKSEVIRDKSDCPFKMIGVIQDVTEWQKLVERLQQSEKLYKQAQAISHIGNWKWDFETRALEWSDELYRIYELEPDSVDTSISIGLYNHPEDSGLISEAINKAVETLQPFDFEYRIVLKNGKIKTLQAKGEVTPQNEKAKYIFGTLQDITEQKLAQKKLKEYQDFIKKITDVTPSVIAAYNIHTGKYSFINKSVEKLLGYPSTQILDEGVAFFASLIHPDDVNALIEKNTKAIDEANQLYGNASEPIVEFKYRLRNSKGDYRWLHTYGTIFERNAKGLVESVLNISVDITEQETAEQALHNKNLQLLQSNTSLEEYAYVASHDLKEPLRKITTFSDRLLNGQNGKHLDENGKIYLNKIIDASKRMQKMIGDLLSVSTISGNKSFEICDLNYILAEAIQPLEQRIEETKARIETDKLPAIAIVPSQFLQLFQNLVANSLKFSREGVPCFIKIKHSFLNDSNSGDDTLVKKGKFLKIVYEDNGIGFDNQYADKIFTIFQRLHGRTEYEGTGIGLAICKKIVENHGGAISARGNLNKGAVFTITIPV